MKLTTEQYSGLNVAINEASLLALDFHLVNRKATVELRVLALPEEGRPPEDTRIDLLLFPVGRVAASIVGSDGGVKQVGIGDLGDLVRSVGGQPIYGWEFFDPPPGNLADWSNRLSLDFRAGEAGLSHTLHLFQESTQGKLDICLWFDEIEIRDPDGRELAIAGVIAGGKRWWDGVFSGDPRTSGSGIQPLKK
jgi:hypothetical protein